MAILIVGADSVVAYPSGRQLPRLPAGRPMATLLHECTRTFGKEGTVIIRPDALDLLGLPVTLPKRPINVPIIGEAVSLGWRGTDQLRSPWINLYRNGCPTVHILIWGYAETGEMIDKGDPNGTIDRLTVFHQQLGGPWHTSAGTTGVGLLRDHYAPVYKESPEWTPDWSKIPPAQKNCHPEQPLNWQAPMVPPGAVAHIYDANRARLCYAASVKVARGELVHMPRPRFSVKTSDYLCGYWRISRPVWQVDGFPHPAGYRPDSARKPVKVNGSEIITEWVTTPTLELLMEVAEQGYCEPPLIFEGYLAPGTTLLRRWADALETAYWRLPALRDVVKDIYRETSGQLRRGSRRLDRPDWHHTWLAHERSRLWRKWWQAYQAGHMPSRIETDAIWYPSDDADWRTAMPRALALGEGLGQFHPLGTWLLNGEGKPLLDDDGDPILIEADWPGEGGDAGPSLTDHILAQHQLRSRA